MTSKLQRFRGLLELLSRVKSQREIEQFLDQANKETLLLISEICLNILKGNIPLKKKLVKKLKRKREIIRHLRKKKISFQSRKKTLQTGEGLGLLFPLLFPTVAGLILKHVLPHGN